MDLTDYAALDAVGLAALIRSGEVSAAEVHTAALAAIEHVNPILNAAIEVLPDWSDRFAGQPAGGPLWGVPFGVKDLILMMQGVPLDFGSRMVAGRLVAPFDNELAARFKRAGLATLVRTTAPEFGYAPTTESVLRGPTRNPWDPARSPGGSSGGAAALVASGALPIAHASDGGGSIRIPAAYCGLVGLKPTRGRVSFGPTMGEPLHGMAVEFVLTRSVRDAAVALDAVAGAAVGDKFEIAPLSPSAVEASVRAPGPQRIAVTTRAPDGAELDPRCVAAVRSTAATLESLGHHVEEAAPQYDLEAFHRANLVLWSSFTAGSTADLARMLGVEPSPDLLESSVWSAYRYGLELRAVDVEAALAMMNVVSRSVGAFFSDHDVLLSPTMAGPAIPLGTLNTDDPRYGGDPRVWYDACFRGVVPFTALQNMTGQPAISLPLHEADGLPIGLHFSARFGAENLLLGLAGQMEQALPWAGRRPPVHVANPR